MTIDDSLAKSLQAANVLQAIGKVENHNKLYMTVAIGCTGGQHRSVYVVEKLAEYFTEKSMDVIVRHREL